MRCGCPECGAYMIHSEGLAIACVCPECGHRCKMCLGTNSVMGQEEVRAMQRALRAKRDAGQAKSAISVRSLTDADIPAVPQVLKAGYASVVWEAGLNRQCAPEHPAFWQAETLYGLQLLGAEDEAGLVGALALAQEADGMCVRCLTVMPKAQHQGAGSALLTAAEDAARTAGAKEMICRVLRSNARGREWLERRGYVRAGEEAAATLALSRVVLQKEL